MVKKLLAKRQIASFVLIGLVLLVAGYFALSFLPLNLLPLQQKPAPQTIHDYYEILDESSGESLMMVPLVVNVGDELLTEDNRWFRIVKVVEDKAYARRVKR